MAYSLPRFIFPVILTLLFTAPGKTNAQQSTLAVDSFISMQMKNSGLAGLAAAIIVNKKLQWIKGFGYADVANKKLFTPGTIMNIGSITKTFTGVCLLQLAEKKLLSLDEDINNYLPFSVVNPYFPFEKITLRNIATHSSGIADRHPFYGDSVYNFNGASAMPLGKFLRNYFVAGGLYYTDSNFYNAKPGKYWEYSNIAAALAGYIVEVQSGKKLNEYCRENIFKPLGMKQSGWFLSEIDTARHARLYQYKEDSLVTIPWYEITTYPDGGLRTSVEELSKFFIALLNDGVFDKNRILKKESVNAMQQFQFSADNKPDNLDLLKKNECLFWRTKYSGKLIGHGGSDPGIKTEMLTNLSKDVAVILFTNTDLNSKKLSNAYYDIFDYLFNYGKQIKEGIK
ncbi:MAG TPA: serine hydrolase domain-containing protein [Ferruginibacter sp.]|nr:serine hydrolase domain-containing protein [Ferruginibacter sp.]HRE62872.1 serine hydrolase domain-containing protein [Ferruginibacter sp.]